MTLECTRKEEMICSVERTEDIRTGERRPFQGVVHGFVANPLRERRRSSGPSAWISPTRARGSNAKQPIELRTNVYVQAPAFGLMGNASVRYCRRSGMKTHCWITIQLGGQPSGSAAESAASKSQPGAEKQQSCNLDRSIRRDDAAGEASETGVGHGRLPGAGMHHAGRLPGAGKRAGESKREDWWQYCCAKHATAFANQHGLEMPAQRRPRHVPHLAGTRT